MALARHLAIAEAQDQPITFARTFEVLEEVLRWDSVKIRRFFTASGLMLREWDKTRTDMLTIQESTEHVTASSVTAH